MGDHVYVNEFTEEEFEPNPLRLRSFISQANANEKKNTKFNWNMTLKYSRTAANKRKYVIERDNTLVAADVFS